MLQRAQAVASVAAAGPHLADELVPHRRVELVNHLHHRHACRVGRGIGGCCVGRAAASRESQSPWDRQQGFQPTVEHAAKDGGWPAPLTAHLLEPAGEGRPEAAEHLLPHRLAACAAGGQAMMSSSEHLLLVMTQNYINN